MARPGIRDLVGRAMIDRDFLADLVREPARMLAEFDLSSEERAAIMQAVGSKTEGATERERARALQVVLMKRWAT
jgi:hypothetical protein